MLLNLLNSITLNSTTLNSTTLLQMEPYRRLVCRLKQSQNSALKTD